MKNRGAWLRATRLIIAFVLVIAYFAGIVAMLTDNVQFGLTLWGFSTIGGIALLWGVRELEKKNDADRDAREGP